MTSTYHSSLSPFTIDLNDDQNQQLIICSKSSDHVVSSSSSISFPTFFKPLHENAGYHHSGLQPLHHEEEVNIFASHGGSWVHSTLPGELKNNQKLSVCKKQDRRRSNHVNTDNEDHGEREGDCWMSSKVKFGRKMMMCSSDEVLNSITKPQISSMPKFEDGERRISASQEEDDDGNGSKNLSNNGSNLIRVCSDCNTTKTPLWRSGPRGPKSLCNACGIRQRKARRAAMAAAEASSKMHGINEKKTSKNSHLPLKKRCKFTAKFRGSRRKLCFDDLSSVILSKNSTFQQLFPQDEKEAAVLLMALSYGLVHS